ncbi:4-hydroxy-tetrahydrodipicolinate synthase [Marininema mesophilum]|uniref:4-hydroxy-tetrahydrodipicolinate synthase n=1 Tax=Marininema mesophilum TaxID=1048340 RepID=UPI000A8A4E4E|nr:4-hydroxy-tetrahydrodipicolinate synthase [Marininema mesophilum]
MKFVRIMTAMITPMNAECDIDWSGVEAVLEHLVATGTEGVVVSGTTGESPTLTHEEKVQLYTFVAEKARGRVKVIAGAGSNNTRASMELTKEATACGVDGIMLVAPYYNKPTQEGLYQHFRTIAKSTTLPVMVYNVPGRTSVNMSADTMVRLASDVENITAIKEASGNLVQVMDVITNKPIDVEVHSGVDELNLPYLSVGGNGAVSVASHLVGQEMKEMFEAFDRGEIAQAAQIQRKHLPLIRALFMTSSPAPLKYALSRIGVCDEHVRMPVIPLSEEEKEVMNHLLEDLQILR